MVSENIQYLKMVFTKINGYHTHLVHKISRQQLRNKSRSNEVNPDDRDMSRKISVN